jgi:hypothetical protein
MEETMKDRRYVYNLIMQTAATNPNEVTPRRSALDSEHSSAYAQGGWRLQVVRSLRRLVRMTGGDHGAHL